MKPGSKIFTVPPRVLDLKTAPFFMNRGTSASQGDSAGTRVDRNRFAGLSPYREGQSVERMAWKKYAATGLPVLIEAEGSSHRGISIYLDQRRSEREEWDILVEEDCSVEVLTSCVKYLMDKHIKTEVYLNESLFFAGSSPGDFDRYYRKSIYIEFRESRDPMEYASIHRKDGNTLNSSLIITHRMTPETMDRVDHARKQRWDLSVISCIPGFSIEEKRDWQTYITRLNHKGCRIRMIEDADTTEPILI